MPEAKKERKYTDLQEATKAFDVDAKRYSIVDAMMFLCMFAMLGVGFLLGYYYGGMEFNCVSRASQEEGHIWVKGEIEQGGVAFDLNMEQVATEYDAYVKERFWWLD